MATTMFFEEALVHAGTEQADPIELEFGRSSYLDGENLIYVVVDGKSVILSREQGRRFVEAVDALAGYLGIRP